MKQIIIRKIFLGFFYLFVISAVAFVMVRQMPGDPAVLIANQGRETEAPSEMVEQIRREYGFDRGLVEQYRCWLQRVLFEGDLGYSSRTNDRSWQKSRAAYLHPYAWAWSHLV